MIEDNDWFGMTTPLGSITVIDPNKVDFTDPAVSGIVTSRAEKDVTEGDLKAFDNLYLDGTQNVDWSKWHDNSGIPSTNDPTWIQIQLPETQIVSFF